MNSNSRALTSAFVADFNRSAELYEEYQVPFSNVVSPRIATLAGLSAGQSVLDIGTGTGSAALAAAQAVGSTGSVTGIDLAGGMLAVAKRKAAAEGLNNIRFRKMDAKSLGFDRECFDAVVSNLGIPAYCFPEAVSEAHRVLKRGGTLCFAEVTKMSPSWSLFSKALLRYRVRRPPPAASARRKARERFQKAAERYPFSAYAKILRRAGFTKVRTISDTFSAAQPSAEGYLRYFTTREQLEYDAMPEKSKKSFDKEILQGLDVTRKRYHGVVERRVKFWLAEKPRRQRSGVAEPQPRKTAHRRSYRLMC